MGLDKMISAISILAIIAVASGQLPKIINGVHRAQIRLVQESKASAWPKAKLLKPQRSGNQ